MLSAGKPAPKEKREENGLNYVLAPFLLQTLPSKNVSPYEEE